MTRETLDALARELAPHYPLPAEEWGAITVQAQNILNAVAALDDLPLDNVEPATTYRPAP